MLLFISGFFVAWFFSLDLSRINRASCRYPEFFVHYFLLNLLCNLSVSIWVLWLINFHKELFCFCPDFYLVSIHEKKSSADEKDSWTDELKGMLIQVLLTIVEDGNFADNASKQEWMRIMTIFKEMSKKSFTRQQMSSDVSEMKKKLSTYKSIQDLSGVCWNEQEHSANMQNHFFT